MSDEVQKQYATSGNLTRRANLHAAYGRLGWFSWLADRMPFAAKAGVLDVGCGPGWLWRNAAKRFSNDLRLTLLDQSQGMVDEAVKGVTAAGFDAVNGATADARDLPFEDRTFDAVIMMHMLYHVADPSTAIAEAYRVLRPGGQVFVTTNTPGNLAELTAMTAQVFGTSPYDPAALLFSLDDAVGLLEQRFDDVTRHDQTENYACTDPLIVTDFLTSMPPANAATAAQRTELEQVIADTFAAANGTVMANKHTGLVVGTKRPNPLD